MADWETFDETLVTDYGAENPLLYDFYNFDKELYDIKWRSKGDANLSKRAVEAFQKVQPFLMPQSLTNA